MKKIHPLVKKALHESRKSLKIPLFYGVLFSLMLLLGSIFRFYRKRVRKGGVFLSLILLLPCCCAFLFAAEHKTLTPTRIVQAGAVVDFVWVSDCCRRHEELMWLLSIDSAGRSPTTASPSKELKGAYSPRFDRTIKAIECMNCFFDGRYEDYLLLVARQSKERRLEWKSFLEIQREIKGIVANAHGFTEPQLRDLLEALLIYQEASTTEQFAKRSAAMGGCKRKSRMLLSHHLEFSPFAFPSFYKYTDDGQKLVKSLSTYELLSAMQKLEGGKELFRHFREEAPATLDADYLGLVFFLHQCRSSAEGDIASDWAHCSYDENQHRALVVLKGACQLLSSGSGREAFDDYFMKRADWLGFDVGSPLNRVLARIGTMLGLYEEQDGRTLKEALLKFAPDELSLIVEEFGLTKGEKAPRLPLFTPEVLVNLSSNPALGTGPKERLTQALHIGLPLLAKVMRSNQENDGKREALDFCLVAELAQIDPSRLIRKNFSIEESGIVQMAN